MSKRSVSLEGLFGEQPRSRETFPNGAMVSQSGVYKSVLD